MRIGDGATVEWLRFPDLTADTLYEILRFRQAIFVVEQSSPYPDLDGLDQGAHHLLLRIDGSLSGCLRLIPYPQEKRVAIGRLAVATALRRQGFARLMMNDALARARREYADCAITLSAQTYLAPFYGSFGFRPTSPPYDDYGVPHVEMAREPASG